MASGPLYYPGRLRALRKESGLSKAAVARWVNVKPTAVRAWERGEAAIPAAEQVRLAERLGVSAKYLMGEENIDCADRDAEVVVLREAADALESCAERLPPGSNWWGAFVAIRQHVFESMDR